MRTFGRNISIRDMWVEYAPDLPVAASSSRRREPREVLDIVRAWAAALGSKRELLEGDGGRSVNGLFSSPETAEGAIVETVRIRFPWESNLDLLSGEREGAGSSFKNIFEPMLAAE